MTITQEHVNAMIREAVAKQRHRKLIRDQYQQYAAAIRACNQAQREREDREDRDRDWLGWWLEQQARRRGEGK